MAEASFRYRNNFRSKKCDLSTPKIVQLDIVDESPDGTFTFMSANNLMRNGIVLNDCINYKERDNATDTEFFHLQVQKPCDDLGTELVADDNLKDILYFVDAKNIAAKDSCVTISSFNNILEDNSRSVGMKILDADSYSGISDIFSLDSIVINDESVNKSNAKLHLTSDVSDLLSFTSTSGIKDYEDNESNKTKLQVTSNFSDLLSTITLQDDDCRVSQNGSNKLPSFSDSSKFSIENIHISDLNEIHYKTSEAHINTGENFSDILSSICNQNNESTSSSLSESYFSDSNTSPDESRLKSLSNEKCDFLSSASSEFSTSSSFSDDTNFLSGGKGNKFPINLEPQLDSPTMKFSFFNTSPESNLSLSQLLCNGNASTESIAATENRSEISEKDISMLDLLKAVNFEPNAVNSDCCKEAPQNSVSSYVFQSTEDELLNNIDLSACLKTADCLDSIQTLTGDKNAPVHNKNLLNDILNLPIDESVVQEDEIIYQSKTKILYSSIDADAMFCDNYLPSGLYPESSTAFSLHVSCLKVPRTNRKPSLFSKALSYKFKKDSSDVQKVSSIKSDLLCAYFNRPFLVDAPAIPPKTVSFSDGCVLPFVGRRVYGSDRSCELL